MTLTYTTLYDTLRVQRFRKSKNADALGRRERSLRRLPESPTATPFRGTPFRVTPYQTQPLDYIHEQGASSDDTTRSLFCARTVATRIAEGAFVPGRLLLTASPRPYTHVPLFCSRHLSQTVSFNLIPSTALAGPRRRRRRRLAA